MHVLTRTGWQDSFVDYACGQAQIQIRPQVWVCLGPVADQYFERTRDLRRVLAYGSEIGAKAVVRKILSRRAERHRNQKFLSIGQGRVESVGGSATRFGVGDLVVFIATNHPRCVERLVVDARLAQHCTGEMGPGSGDHAIAFLDAASSSLSGSLQKLAALKGWIADSGIEPRDIVILPEILSIVDRHLQQIDLSACTRLAGSSVSAVVRPARSSERCRTRPTAVLFGYGNYAKTVIIPNIRHRLDLRAIHEIDPLQIPAGRAKEITWSANPEFGGDDEAAAVLAAGYHHTHADLAIAAMRAGAAAVVEKPIVTSREQLRAVLDAMEATSGRFFACFQRRYSPMNEWLLEDLAVRTGEPLSYYCIVYEEPLPSQHWYRWPNSRGRIVSNGCHWIDHFLFLNDFVGTIDRNVYVAPDGTVTCNLALANGATFSMVLTDRGVSRTGMQNYIEIRAAGGTARLLNDRHYDVEIESGRRRRILGSRLYSHELMYRRISTAVVAGHPGDSQRSIAESATAMLELEALAEQYPAYRQHTRQDRT